MIPELTLFSYDPRRVPQHSALPIGFCKHCRCPQPYCANIVLATDVYEELFFLLYLNTYKSVEDSSPRGLKMLFAYYYKRAVHAKMCCNEIHFPMGFNLSKGFDIPRRVKNRFKDLLELVQHKTTEEEEEYGEDLTEIKLERFATKYCKNDDEIHAYYDQPLN